MTPSPERPVLRFAPSPNGRLHLGHAYSALLNAHHAARLGGRLLLRIEDIDPVRSRPDLIAGIAVDLDWLGVPFEAGPRRQSEHLPAYRAGLDRLIARGLAYPCFCSRGAIRARAAAMRAAGAAVALDPDGSPLYPGTCRGLPPAARAARLAAGEPHTWRLDGARARAAVPGPLAYAAFDPEGDGAVVPVAAAPARWGDPVIARRDVPASYHLCVVLDDAAQAITHVVRGADLRAATDLHALLQRLLGLPAPLYGHHRLILGEDGDKLAKSRDAPALAGLRAAGIAPGAVRAQLGFT